MTNYKRIEMESFERRMYYDYFMSEGTTLSMTVKINVTKALARCRQEGWRFYGFSIHCLTGVVNSIENMRYDLIDEELVLWESLTPGFTSFNQQSKHFHALWIDYQTNPQKFDLVFKQIVEQYQDSDHISPREHAPANLFNISAIPWVHFDSFVGHNQKSHKNLLPIVSLGKYQTQDEETWMPVNLKVHHATMDGYHLALFFEKLQKAFDGGSSSTRIE